MSGGMSHTVPGLTPPLWIPDQSAELWANWQASQVFGGVLVWRMGCPIWPRTQCGLSKLALLNERPNSKCHRAEETVLKTKPFSRSSCVAVNVEGQFKKSLICLLLWPDNDWWIRPFYCSFCQVLCSGATVKQCTVCLSSTIKACVRVIKESSLIFCGCFYRSVLSSTQSVDSFTDLK